MQAQFQNPEIFVHPLNFLSNTDLILQDGLSIRQEFCNIVNKVFNLHIWCEAKEQQDELLMGDNPDNNSQFENENNNDGGDFNE